MPLITSCHEELALSTHSWGVQQLDPSLHWWSGCVKEGLWGNFTVETCKTCLWASVQPGWDCCAEVIQMCLWVLAQGILHVTRRITQNCRLRPSRGQEGCRVQLSESSALCIKEQMSAWHSCLVPHYGPCSILGSEHALFGQLLLLCQTGTPCPMWAPLGLQHNEHWVQVRKVIRMAVLLTATWETNRRCLECWPMPWPFPMGLVIPWFMPGCARRPLGVGKGRCSAAGSAVWMSQGIAAVSLLCSQHRVLVPLHGPGWGRGAVHVRAGVLLWGAVWAHGGDGHRATALPGPAVPDAGPC